MACYMPTSRDDNLAEDESTEVSVEIEMSELLAVTESDAELHWSSLH